MSLVTIRPVEIAENKGCCYNICKCFYPEVEEETPNLNKTTSKDVPNSVKSSLREINNNQATNLLYNNFNTFNNDNDPILQHVKETTKKFQLDTNIPINLLENDIKMRRDETVDIKYNCPICMRYFNYILQTSCCNNYICKFCADQYLCTMIKYQSIIKCPICNVAKEIILTDVKPGSEVYKLVIED